MEPNIEISDNLYHSLSEVLRKQIVEKGIEGKHNNLICFADDRASFVANASETIAWTALEKRLSSSNYCIFGLNGIDKTGFEKLFYSIPSYDTVQNYLRVQELFRNGARDYLTVSREGIISYSWLPHTDSAGDVRMGRNVLVAVASSGEIEGLITLAKGEPGKVYELMLSSLYPNSLIPLKSDEIIEAIKKEGPELLRRIKFQRPQMIKQYEAGLVDPESLVEFVQSQSILKRRMPCEEVNVQVV
jgi:hypothetical protein